MALYNNRVDTYKGDNTSAFGMHLLRIWLKNPSNAVIPRVDVIIGDITKTINQPDFPLYVDLTSYESKLLKSGSNTLALVAYDQYYKPHICVSKRYVNAASLRKS